MSNANANRSFSSWFSSLHDQTTTLIASLTLATTKPLHKQNQGSLHLLPYDVYHHMAVRYLDPLTVLNLSLVSRSLYHLIGTDHQLWLHLARQLLESECIAPHSLCMAISNTNAQDASESGSKSNPESDPLLTLTTHQLKAITTRPARFISTLQQRSIHLKFTPLNLGIKFKRSGPNYDPLLDESNPNANANANDVGFGFGYRSKSLGWSDPYRLLPGGRWMISLSRRFIRCWDINAAASVSSSSSSSSSPSSFSTSNAASTSGSNSVTGNQPHSAHSQPLRAELDLSPFTGDEAFEWNPNEIGVNERSMDVQFRRQRQQEDSSVTIVLYDLRQCHVLSLKWSTNGTPSFVHEAYLRITPSTPYSQIEGDIIAFHSPSSSSLLRLWDWKRMRMVVLNYEDWVEDPVGMMEITPPYIILMSTRQNAQPAILHIPDLFEIYSVPDDDVESPAYTQVARASISISISISNPINLPLSTSSSASAPRPESRSDSRSGSEETFTTPWPPGIFTLIEESPLRSWKPSEMKSTVRFAKYLEDGGGVRVLCFRRGWVPGSGSGSGSVLEGESDSDLNSNSNSNLNPNAHSNSNQNQITIPRSFQPLGKASFPKKTLISEFVYDSRLVRYSCGIEGPTGAGLGVSAGAGINGDDDNGGGGSGGLPCPSFEYVLWDPVSGSSSHSHSRSNSTPPATSTSGSGLGFTSMWSGTSTSITTASTASANSTSHPSPNPNPNPNPNHQTSDQTQNAITSGRIQIEDIVGVEGGRPVPPPCLISGRWLVHRSYGDRVIAGPPVGYLEFR